MSIHPALLYKAQKGRCFHCGCQMEQFSDTSSIGVMSNGWTREHFIPKSKLKFTPKYNIVLAHCSCNQKRGSRYPTRREVKRFYNIHLKVLTG